MKQRKKLRLWSQVKQALSTKALRRTTYSIAPIPVIAMLAPHQATAANESMNALSGQSLSSSPALVFSDYLNFTTSTNANSIGNLLSENFARDAMIGAMFAICIAMIAGASFLFRENVNHIRLIAEEKKRNGLGDF